MRLKRLEVLSSDEVEAIHSASVDLLSTTGIKIESKETRALLAGQGALPDDETTLVRIPESVLKEALRTVPSSFTLHGNDPSFSFEVTTNDTVFATIGTPVKIHDPSHKRGIRDTVLKDTIDQLKIVDGLDHVMNSHVDVWPNDVPYLALHAHVIRAWATNCKKPYVLGVFGRRASQDMIDMTAMVVGGVDELVKHPRLVGFFNTTSPLLLPQVMTNGFEVFAKHGQPTIIAPEAMAGSTAPVTLAGLLVQTNAEILAGIVLSQAFKKGAPVLFGTVSNITDLSSGNSAMGSIETGLITAGIAQLARRYHVPSRGPGCVTDSKVLDVQAGFERMHTMLLAAQAGINYITCAGTYEATLAEALELLVIDDELAGMVNRAVDGIVVNEDTIALETIKKVTKSKDKNASFLGEKHTIKHMKKEIYRPELVNRERRSRWYKNGAKDIIAVARERVDQILKEHVPPRVDPALDVKLLDFIKTVESRTMDDYRAAEGLSSGSPTLPGSRDLE
ncbi:MAG: hypothetical protein GYA24_12445 [Candidatus Lokiarchaeota archaeon]|nr:hypothetical protein [Candidatus Lokiarchaeota archaeon]